MSTHENSAAQPRPIAFPQAISEALREEMERDESIIILGLDVARRGGTFGLEKGLSDRWPNRVIDTPISEPGFVGTGIGAAIGGLRPYVSILYSDFMLVAADQIINHAAKIRFLSGGQIKVPIVISTAIGRGRSAGAQHSQTLLATFMHIPGLRVLAPSTPYDGKGLLKTALRQDNPVIFFTHAILLRDAKSIIPPEEYTIPIGQADIKKKGEDATLVAILSMVPIALAAAEVLERQGISTEVIDPRSISPMDKKTIIDSVKRTGRLIIAEEECKTGGVGAEISAMIAEEAMDYLDAPIRRVATIDTPIPYNPAQEKYVLPDQNRIVEAIRAVVGAAQPR